MSLFWRSWLVGWCMAVIVFGLVLAGAALPQTDGAVRALMRLLHGSRDVDLDAPLRFSIGLMGCVTLGWGLTLLPALEAAQRLGAAHAGIWRGLAGGVAAWFLLDSLISVGTGFGLNAVSNTVLLVAFMAPLIASGVLSASTARRAATA